ncbi:MAG TPA: hypothetical protein VGN16_11165 [Acidobacteriaceae bacterium]
MNLNVANAFTIRLVPQGSTSELYVSMTAVPDGTKTLFAAPPEPWDEYAHQLREMMGITPDLLEEATGRLRRGTTAKLFAKCFVGEITRAGFDLVRT